MNAIRTRADVLNQPLPELYNLQLEIRDAPGALPIPVPRRFEPTRPAVFADVHAAGGVEGASATRAVFFYGVGFGRVGRFV